jgi:hypothetical protein
MSDNVNVQGSSTPVAVSAGSVQGSGTPVVAPVSNPVGVPVLHRYQEAFDRALPASQALDAKALTIINIDVPSAVTLTVGKLPGIMALRDQAQALPGFDVSAFDQLETYTLAIGQAHSTYMRSSASPEAIVALNEKGMQLRTTLYTDAVALVTRKLLSGDRIKEFKANIGYKNLAFDLMALAGLLRSKWDEISSRTAITTDELDQAELISDQLISAVGTREDVPADVAAVSLQRQRNFTLFLKAYDQVRRAVTFLRWNEDDSDHIAPSLYSGRGNSNARKKSDAAPPAAGEPATGAPAATGATATGSQPLPVAPAEAGPAVDSTAAAHTTTPTVSGFPGSNPFVAAS